MAYLKENGKLLSPIGLATFIMEVMQEDSEDVRRQAGL